MRLVRVGIVGIGNMGSAHASNIYLDKVKGMKLTAVCDIDAERLQWAKETFKGQVECYDNYHCMLKSGKIDAVIIATPHNLHPLIGCEAFDEGLHVLTEKPAGIDTKNVQKMNERALASGRVFGIMYNQRTNYLYNSLRNIVQEGKLGDIKRMVWIVSNWYRTQAYYDSGKWRGTRNGEGGGVLLNQCPHNLDIWQWILGMPVRIRAFCKTGQYHNINVEDDVTIYAEYDNHASAVFITSTGEYPGTNRMEISGTKGKAVLEKGELQLFLLDQDERFMCMNSIQGMPEEKVHTEIIKEVKPSSGHLGILQNFANAILWGEQLIAPGIDGIKGLMISNAAYLSEWSNDWVSLPLNEEEFIAGLKQKQTEEKIREKNMTGEKLYGEYSERWDVKW
ncbi:MAG: Gfo/Idh/MocA family oxidoreductase [Staphylococcus equorum]|nr:Gfo/Idh/MocA family oxidoreductase [Staphylococcus equorum]